MDPFALLGVPRRFDLDLGALEKTHRELSRALHPDRFSQAGASERRASLEKMASVNEAWRIVRDPIRRAEALFRLAGAEVGENEERSHAAPTPAFLMEVLEEREALSEAKEANDLAKVAKIGATMKGRASGVEAKLTAAFSQEHPNVGALLPLLGELRFYRRFLDEVSAIEEEAEERAAT